RIGCFLNGCCYGETCDAPWAVSFPYESIPYKDQLAQGLIDTSAAHALPVHPTQLYSTFTAFLIAALCLAYFTLPHARGRVFALMLMVEGPTRYLLELLRVEPPVAYFRGYGLSLSMILGIAMFVLGVVMWFIFGVLDRPAPEP